MNFQVKANPAGAFWFGWFMATIAIVGAVLAYGLVLPLALVGRVPRFRRGADAILQRGISWLMRLQPWFAADIDLTTLGENRGRGQLLVSNHRSHLDAFILLSRVRGIRILAKSSLFQIPFLGAMMKASKQIPVRRGDLASYGRAMEAIGREAGRGEVVHVFAEMTRCPPGWVGTQEFFLAPFHEAMKGKFPVVPLVFEGTDSVWPRSKLSLSFRRPVRVRSLAPLDPAEFASADALRRETRRRIDGELAR